MFRKSIFDRLMSVSVFVLCSADGGGEPAAGASGDAGGGSSASSPPTSPSGGGGGGESSGTEPSPATAEPSDPWAGLGQIDFEPEMAEAPPEPAAPAPTTPAPTQPQQQPPAPQAPPPAQPPAQPQPPKAPEPAAPQAPQGQPQAAAPMPSVAEPMELAAFMVDPKNLPQVIDFAAQQYYQLSDDDVKAIETDVVTALPKLMGRVHAQAVASAMRFIGQSVPQMYERLSATKQANSAAQDKFFGAAGKSLDKNNPEHVKAAAQVVSMYRKMNPNATMDQVIQMCVPTVHAALGLQYAAAPAAAPGSPPQQPSMRPVQQVFQPAIPANGAPPQPQAAGPYDGLGAVFDE